MSGTEEGVINWKTLYEMHPLPWSSFYADHEGSTVNDKFGREINVDLIVQLINQHIPTDTEKQ